MRVGITPPAQCTCVGCLSTASTNGTNGVSKLPVRACEYEVDTYDIGLYAEPWCRTASESVCNEPPGMTK